jgi:hypothetical protein
MHLQIPAVRGNNVGKQHIVQLGPASIFGTIIGPAGQVSAGDPYWNLAGLIPTASDAQRTLRADHLSAVIAAAGVAATAHPMTNAAMRDFTLMGKETRMASSPHRGQPCDVVRRRG